MDTSQWMQTEKNKEAIHITKEPQLQEEKSAQALPMETQQRESLIDDLRKDMTSVDLSQTTERLSYRPIGSPDPSLDLAMEQPAYRTTSITGELRKQSLAGGKKLEPAQVKAYAEEHKEWTKKRDRNAAVRFHETQTVNMKLLTDLSRQFAADKGEASDSFKQLRNALAVFVNISDVTNLKKNDMESFPADYEAAYQNALSAARNYLDTHSSRRWSSSGKFRKNSAAKILEALNALKENKSMTVAAYTQMSQFADFENQDEEEFKKEVQSQRKAFDAIEVYPMNEERIKQTIAGGSTLEKLKILFEINRQQFIHQSSYHELDGGNDLNSDLSDYATQLIKSVAEADPATQLEFVREMVRMNISVIQDICSDRKKHLSEAPDGFDPETYAMYRMKYSASVNAKNGFDTFVTTLVSESEILAHLYKIISMGYHGMDQKHADDFTEADQICLKATSIKYNHNDFAIPKEIRDKTNEDRAAQVKKLEESGLMIPKYMKDICQSAKALEEDNEEASESFQTVKNAMHAFYVQQHEPIVNRLSYGQSYQNALAAAKAYHDSHNRYHFTEKGDRRFNLVETIIAQLTDLKKHRPEFLMEREQIPENETEKDRLARIDRMTQEVISASGYKDADYRNYLMVSSAFSFSNGIRNSRDVIDWDKRLKDYNRGRESQERIDSRIFTVFIKGCKLDENGVPTDEAEAAKLEADRRFMDDYLTQDIEKRKPYLNQYINSLLQTKFSMDMLEPEYAIEHFEELERMMQGFTLIQNVLEDEQINADYLASLPDSVRERLKKLNELDYPSLTGLWGAFKQLMGITVSKGKTMADGDEMKRGKQIFDTIKEMLNESETMKILDDFRNHPMVLEEELAKQES